MPSCILAYRTRMEWCKMLSIEAFTNEFSCKINYKAQTGRLKQRTAAKQNAKRIVALVALFRYRFCHSRTVRLKITRAQEKTRKKRNPAVWGSASCFGHKEHVSGASIARENSFRTFFGCKAPPPCSQPLFCIGQVLFSLPRSSDFDEATFRLCTGRATLAVVFVHRGLIFKQTTLYCIEHYHHRCDRPPLRCRGHPPPRDGAARALRY